MSSAVARKITGDLFGEYDRLVLCRRALTAIELDGLEADPDLENMRHLATMISQTLFEHIESVYLKHSGMIENGTEATTSAPASRGANTDATCAANTHHTRRDRTRLHKPALAEGGEA